jgi:hypothetical protein
MPPGVSTFALRLPNSLKAAVERIAAADRTSMNQFLVMAAAEKLSAIQTAEAYFSERRGQGDRAAALANCCRVPPLLDVASFGLTRTVAAL